MTRTSVQVNLYHMYTMNAVTCEYQIEVTMVMLKWMWWMAVGMLNQIR